MYKVEEVSYEKVFEYIDAYNYVKEENMDKFRKEAEDNHVPIIKRDVENYLRTLLPILKPKSILEIGCAVGYSAIFMSKTLQKKVKIDTLEIKEEMAQIAKKNIVKFDMDNIQVIVGDARQTIPRLTKKYDMVFIDASKGHYEEFYDLAVEKVEKNAVVICDNILERGYLCMEKEQVPRRMRTMYKNMRHFLEKCKADTSISYNLLPLGDGLLIIHHP